jgi:hypothetical protein
LVVSDADMDGLPDLLSLMTKHTPPVDDDDLIEHLRGGVEPIEDLPPSHSGGITGIVNSLLEKETYDRYSKTFIPKQESEQASSISMPLREVVVISDCIVLQLLQIWEDLHWCSRSRSLSTGK